jgi:hypothetical protein
MDNGNIPDGAVLYFRLDVTNCSPWSDYGTCGWSSAGTTVAIKNSATTDTLTGVTATWRTARARLDVNATTSAQNAIVEVVGFGVMGPALPNVAGVPASPNDRSYTQVGVNPMPAEITVRTSLGAVVTVPVTVRQ